MSPVWRGKRESGVIDLALLNGPGDGVDIDARRIGGGQVALDDRLASSYSPATSS
jgi:hypothetical protein